MEHRCGRRSPLDMSGRLHLSSGRVIEGRLKNLSLSGALMHTDGPVPLLSRVVLEVDNDDLRQAHLHRITGYVVREATQGIGIEWAEFAPTAVTVLLSWSAARLPANGKSQRTQNSHRPAASMCKRVLDQLPGHRGHVRLLRGNGADATVPAHLPGAHRK
jgi:hypothetical protein